MTTKITVSLTLDTDAPTVTDVANAVRRASTALDKAVLVPSIPVVAKGVTIKTKAVKQAVKPLSPIRTWAVENGHPEVAGKRGRLPLAVIAEYNEAHGK
jgi:hypothetical protein